MYGIIARARPIPPSFCAAFLALLTFVPARAFADGTQMRQDLRGTI